MDTWQQNAIIPGEIGQRRRPVESGCAGTQQRSMHPHDMSGMECLDLRRGKLSMTVNNTGRVQGRRFRVSGIRIQKTVDRGPPQCPRMSHPNIPSGTFEPIYNDLQDFDVPKCPKMSRNVPECPSYGGGSR